MGISINSILIPLICVACFSFNMQAQEETIIDDSDISIKLVLGANFSGTFNYKDVHENVPMIGLVAGARMNKKLWTPLSLRAGLLYSRNVFRFSDIPFYKKRFQYLILPLGFEYQLKKVFIAIGPNVNYMLSGKAIYTEKEEFIDISNSFSQLTVGYFFSVGFNLMDYNNTLRVETGIKKIAHIYTAELKFVLSI